MNALLDHKWGVSPAADQVWALVAGLGEDAPKWPMMVLEAYIDESIGEDGTFVMAGHIAPAENWAKFSAEWENALRTHGSYAGDGIYHFKYKEMQKSEWRKGNIEVFRRILDRHVTLSISFKIDIGDVKKACRGISILNRKIEFDAWSNPWFVCFRFLMDFFHERRSEFSRFIDKDARVDFIFDEQDGMDRKVTEAWFDYLDRRDPSIRNLFGSAPIFRDDKKFLPLQAADYWAGFMREWYVNGKSGDVFSEMPSDERKRKVLIVEKSSEELIDNYIDLARSHALPGEVIFVSGRDPIFC